MIATTATLNNLEAKWLASEGTLRTLHLLISSTRLHSNDYFLVDLENMMVELEVQGSNIILSINPATKLLRFNPETLIIIELCAEPHDVLRTHMVKMGGLCPISSTPQMRN